MRYLDTFVFAKDMHYDHKPKVVPLFRNRADAVLQAHTSHLSVETDRANMRGDLMSDLMRQRREYEERIAGIDAALMELAGG